MGDPWVQRDSWLPPLSLIDLEVQRKQLSSVGVARISITLIV